MTTHPAILTTAPRAPLTLEYVPTLTPTTNEVKVHNEWTASTPLDLHQADGGLLITHPQILGDGTAGTVVEVGPDVKRLKVGDRVFGFTWRTAREKAFQTFVVVAENLLGVVPEGVGLGEAVTLPNNFVSAFHALTADLGLALPWPKPEEFVPAQQDEYILIWGGSSSVGQFALQILKYYGYRNLLSTSSKRNHGLLREFGATDVFDYTEPDVVEKILEGRKVGLILDCIGSSQGSVKPVSQIATAGTKVAILLPVIVKDATETEAPEYAMDVAAAAPWAKGVDVRGVRTHFYLDNPFFAEHLQPTIMPAMLAQGIVKPNKQKIVEGKTMLERAQRALDTLRSKSVSGERLVWRVADE